MNNCIEFKSYEKTVFMKKIDELSRDAGYYVAKRFESGMKNDNQLFADFTRGLKILQLNYTRT